MGLVTIGMTSYGQVWGISKQYRVEGNGLLYLL